MVEPDEPNDAPDGGADSTHRSRLWGIDPDGAADWLTAVLSNLLFALPFAVVVLVLWKLLLEQLPGFNLQFFYPAVLLLLGGYALYAKHRHDTRTAVRRSLLVELTAAEQAMPAEGPIDNPLPTTVYEATADRIGVLPEREVDALVSFYSLAQAANRDELVDDATAERLRRRHDHAVTTLSDGLGAEASIGGPVATPERTPQ